ncbi:MAG: RNA polymerase sigma factor [Bacteroidetes bacterium]|nr:RNA polymerase sigma factor [Bacteroidota bacterium]
MNAAAHMTDEEMIKSCVSGDPQAQKLLYDRHSKKMMGICLRYASDEQEAEDMMQEGWIKVFNNIHSFRFEGSVEGWIKRIMVNTSLDCLRKNKNRFNLVDINETQETIVSGVYSSDNLSTKELLKVIQQLPPGYRSVFNLYAIEGYSHKEIGELLGIHENTSKSQYSRARVQLQRMIQMEFA